MGEKLDANSGDQLKPGAFVYLPATMPHSVSTKGETTVVQPAPDHLDSTTSILPTIRTKVAHMRYRVRASLNGASDHHKL